MDLFFRRSSDVPDLDVLESLAVGGLVTPALSEAAVWWSWSPAEASSRRRAAVWEAMGKVSVDLEIGAAATLGLLRARASGTGGSVDDVAADLPAARLRPEELRAPPADTAGALSLPSGGESARSVRRSEVGRSGSPICGAGRSPRYGLAGPDGGGKLAASAAHHTS
jgi:hypothetical protein